MSEPIQMLTRLAALSMIAFYGSLLMGATIQVPLDYPDLSDAIGVAQDGDDIVLDPNFSPYTGTGFRGISVTNKQLTIRGGGSKPEDVIIDGGSVQGLGCVQFELDPNTYSPGDVSVENLTFRFFDGKVLSCTPSFAAIRNCVMYQNSQGVTGAWKVENCQFFRNGSAQGGALNIGLPYADCSITDSLFVGNLVDAGMNGKGGALCITGSSDPNSPSPPVAITRCTFAKNSAYSGGAVFLAGLPGSTVALCRFVGNSAFLAGAALQYHALSLSPSEPGVIDSCLFAGNCTTTNGNGIALEYSWGWVNPLGLKVLRSTFLGSSVRGVVEPNSLALGTSVLWGIGAFSAKSLIFSNNLTRRDIGYPSFLDPNTCIFAANHLSTDGDPGLNPGPTGTWSSDATCTYYPEPTTTLTDANAPWSSSPQLLTNMILVPDANSPADAHYLVKGATATTVTVWGTLPSTTVTGQSYRFYGWHLVNASPCRNTGDSEGLTIDLDGQTRDDEPDKGCDEYVCGNGSGIGYPMVVLGILCTVGVIRRRHR